MLQARAIASKGFSFIYQVFLKAPSNSAHKEKLSHKPQGSSNTTKHNENSHLFWLSHSHGLHLELLYELEAILDLTRNFSNLGSKLDATRPKIHEQP